MTDAAEPYISRRPQLTIGGVTLDCHMRKASLIPTDAEVDTAVFCKPSRKSPGTTTWVLEIDVLQSFGDEAAAGPPIVVETDGLDDQLRPMAKTRQTFLLEMDKLVGPTRGAPHFTGTCWVPSIPVIDAAIGDKSEFTLTFAVEEDPTKLIA